MKKHIVFLILLFVLFSFSSCIHWKKVKYVQSSIPMDTASYESKYISRDFIIRPADKLFIYIYVADKAAGFGFTSDIQSGAGNMLQETSSYVVNDSGYVDIPIAGKIKLAGLKIDSARDSITRVLKPFLSNFHVYLRIQNKSITFLGEFIRPGILPVEKEQISILEAAALAGDISYFGDKTKVLVIREENGKKNFNYIDLTKRDCVTSKWFYLNPGDIVYVEPIKAKYWSVQSVTLSVAFTVISLVIALTSLIRSVK